jgi:hypothetical protein
MWAITVTKAKRWPLVLAAVFCGTMALLGVALSIFTSFDTRGIQNIAVDAGGSVSIENRLAALWVLPTVQLVWALPLIYAAIRWKAFVERTASIEAMSKPVDPAERSMNVPAQMTFVLVISCVFEAVLLSMILQNCAALLSKA